ncbi:TOBE domain-containing protein [Pseudophaeobacter leonis]|uniref:TOBE domain-containing protein n=1 Tax=Pseudophaeobacter leonis TaxID=1144477 RepID=UPI001F4E33F4|nr:TOBE domain-containing protein [Pseudophaeobacter leonis]
MAIADRVAVMSHGKIAQIGTPETLYRAPESEFVARFIGAAMPLGTHIKEDTLHFDCGSLQLLAPPTGKTAFVRAEDVRLDDNGPLRAKVLSVTFLGTHYRIALQGLAPDPVFALHAALSAPKVGDSVRIAIAPAAILLLPDEKKAA